MIDEIVIDEIVIAEIVIDEVVIEFIRDWIHLWLNSFVIDDFGLIEQALIEQGLMLDICEP